MTTYELIKLLIILLVLFGLIVGGITIYRNITGKLRAASRQLFGTDDFVEGFNRNADILAETPKEMENV